MGSLPIILFGVMSALAWVLYPYKHLVMFILTGKVNIRESCPLPDSPPKLTFLEVKNCADVDETKEPCVVRNAVSQSKIDQFIKESGDNLFLVKDEAGVGVLGNPLIEGRFTKENNDFVAESHMCSINDLINHKKECINTYAGFKSLNYSNYVPLDTKKDGVLDIDTITRTDIFLGHPENTAVTASFHSNNFEKSATLQIVGGKVWLMMPKESYFDLFQATAVGSYNAAANVCTEDLAKVPLQAIKTVPGDIMKFPKAYPHHIYTLGGPNVMINFRNFEINPFNPRDVLSLIAQGAKVKPGLEMKECEATDDQPVAPTSFAQNNIGASFFAKNMFGDMDMRCISAVNTLIIKYKNAVAASAMNRQWDQSIFDQALKFTNAK